MILKCIGFSNWNITYLKWQITNFIEYDLNILMTPVEMISFLLQLLFHYVNFDFMFLFNIHYNHCSMMYFNLFYIANSLKSTYFLYVMFLYSSFEFSILIYSLLYWIWLSLLLYISVQILLCHLIRLWSILFHSIEFFSFFLCNEMSSHNLPLKKIKYFTLLNHVFCNFNISTIVYETDFRHIQLEIWRNIYV